MELSDLRIFRAVVEEGGVTRAAERLHRAQSNVTTRIRQLEQSLGVDLFIREGKRMHLAPAGQVLKGYADRMLALAAEAEDAVLDSRPRGTLRLGAMESAAAVRLPPVLTEYHHRHPAVTLELRTGNPEQLAAALLAGELDAAFVTKPMAKGPFESAPAFVEELVIAAPAGHAPLDAPADGTQTMIAFETGCPHRRWLEGWYRSRDDRPDRVIELGSYHAMLGCVVAGMGIALLPKSVLSTFPESRRLSVHPLPDGQDRLATVLIWRRGAGSPNIRALVEILGTAGEAASTASDDTS